MTTFTISGFRVDSVDGTAIDAAATSAMITVPGAGATFSYSVIGNDEGVPEVEITANTQQVLIDWMEISDFDAHYDATYHLAEVSWQGNKTTVLVINAYTGVDSDSLYVFTLGGKPLPPITDAAAWESFDDSLTGIAVPGGAFAPDTNIRWSEFDNASVTEDDELFGTSGRDKLFGGAGDDYFVSSQGNDTFAGGVGYDQVSFQNDPGGVIANLGTARATDGWGNTDVLKSIESLRGSLHADKLYGNGGNNVIRGLAGNDTLNGGTGRDQVRYDRDSRFEGGDHGVTVHLGQRYAIDGFGDRDTLLSFEIARGSDQDDTLNGSGAANRLEGLLGNDSLNGMTGRDTLDGGEGNDTLNGGKKNDVLRGGAGDDVFIFFRKFGHDTIEDFSTAGTLERISFKFVLINSFRDLRDNHLTEQDGNAVITAANGFSVTLIGVGADDLSRDDFIF